MIATTIRPVIDHTDDSLVMSHTRMVNTEWFYDLIVQTTMDRMNMEGMAMITMVNTITIQIPSTNGPLTVQDL